VRMLQVGVSESDPRTHFTRKKLRSASRATLSCPAKICKTDSSPSSGQDYAPITDARKESPDPARPYRSPDRLITAGPHHHDSGPTSRRFHSAAEPIRPLIKNYYKSA